MVYDGVKDVTPSEVWEQHIQRGCWHLKGLHASPSEHRAPQTPPWRGAHHLPRASPVRCLGNAPSGLHPEAGAAEPRAHRGDLRRAPPPSLLLQAGQGGPPASSSCSELLPLGTRVVVSSLPQRCPERRPIRQEQPDRAPVSRCGRMPGGKDETGGCGGQGPSPRRQSIS